MTKPLLYLTGILLVFTSCDPGSTDIHEGLIPVNNTELYVKVMGDGEAVVFLHGGPGLSHDYFLPHLEPMAEELQLIFYDTAGVNRLHLNLQETYLQTQQLLSYLPPPTEPVNLLPELEQLAIPTLIIRAEMEPIPEASDRRIQQSISGARLITIPYAGHFPFIEQPEAYIDEVLRFVKNKGA